MQDFGESFDKLGEELTADKRLDDCMQNATPASRKAILAELIKGCSGIGAAGHAVVVRIAPEVVGVMGNMVGAFYSKS